MANNNQAKIRNSKAKIGPFNDLSETWIINLSDRIFDQAEQQILKLDPKFQLSPKRICAEQLIANIESKLSHLITNKNVLEQTRISLVNAINANNAITHNLTKEQFRAMMRIKKYQDIVITSSDKGNKTVVLNKQDYLTKIYDILSDTSVYEEISQDNTRTIANKLISLLKTYKKQGFINQWQYKNLYPVNFDIPIVYALIKVHKPNCPARLICPYFQHPLSKLAKYLSDLISPTIRKSQFSIRDSAQFSKDVQAVNLTRNDIMISLDIVNLFTNIPITETIEIIKNNLTNDKDFNIDSQFDINEITKLIKFCMASTTFLFNEKYYSQKTGAPMGSNLSPIVAEVLVSHIFDQA